MINYGVKLSVTHNKNHIVTHTKGNFSFFWLSNITQEKFTQPFYMLVSSCCRMFLYKLI